MSATDSAGNDLSHFNVSLEAPRGFFFLEFMGSTEVVEILPLSQLPIEIRIIRIRQEGKGSNLAICHP